MINRSNGEKAESSGQKAACLSALFLGPRRGLEERSGPSPAAAAPQRPWDPSAWFQLRSCTHVGSPWIKRRSLTPNGSNKWQMLWNSLSAVTTEGLKGPRDYFHMKAASQQNHGKPLPALWTGWNWDVWSPHIYTTKHKQAHKARLWAGYLSRTWFDGTSLGYKTSCLVTMETEHFDLLHF